MPIIIKHKKKNTIKIHERSVGIKKSYNKAAFFAFVGGMLSIMMISIIIGFSKTYYHAYRGAIIISAIFVTACILAPFVIMFIINANAPYNIVIYDTKIKKFKIFKRGYYRSYVPEDIISMTVKMLPGLKQNTPYGYLIYEVRDITNLKTGTSEIKVLCLNPDEVRENTTQYIKEKINEDTEKRLKKMKLEEKERQRQLESRIHDLHTPYKKYNN